MIGVYCILLFSIQHYNTVLVRILQYYKLFVVHMYCLLCIISLFIYWSHMNDPLSLFYLSQMHKKVLKNRAEHFEKALPNTWMHQPESQKGKSNSSLVIQKKCHVYPGFSHSLRNLSWWQHWSLACGGPTDNMRSVKWPFHHWPD